MALPPAQRAVITLRDVDGLSSEETCDVLGLTEGNQRVLLHRARSKVRAEFERYVEEGDAVMPVREISCQEIVELVTDYLEDALPRNERKAFEEHLAGCPNCTNYLDQMQQAMKITGRLTEEALDPELRTKLLDAFRDFKRTGSDEANGGAPDV